MRSSHRRPLPVPVSGSAFVGFRFPPDVIVLAVRWYLRFGLSYRDVEELLAERGVEVDHVSVYRWVKRFTPLLAEAARPCRHAVGERWHADETYIEVGGSWRYLYRAIDQFGQVVDVFLSSQRDARAARRLFTRAIADTRSEPAEVITDRARVYLSALDDLLPATLHDVERYANNVLEADHGRLKSRLQPMRGLKTMASAQLVCSGHAFRPEPPARPLRTCRRRSGEAPARPGHRRARPRNLTICPEGAFRTARFKQRNSAENTSSVPRRSRSV